jgi:hypothetical protein
MKKARFSLDKVQQAMCTNLAIKFFSRSLKPNKAGKVEEFK